MTPSDRSALVAETMTLSELDALERVAKAATPGRWQNGVDDLEGIVAPDNPGLGNVICIPPRKNMYSSLEAWPNNAEHIASFDPPTILRLIALARVGVEDLGSVAAEPLPVVSPTDREPSWRSIETAPHPSEDVAFLTFGNRASWCGGFGIVRAEVSDRLYGEGVTHWMPLPEPPLAGSRSASISTGSSSATTEPKALKPIPDRVEDLGSHAAPLSIEAWRPIETADRKPRPNNSQLGVPIYALIPYRPEPQWTIAWWDEFYECFRHIGEDGPEDIQPTHWQPLPAPPEPQDPPTQDVAL